MAQWRRSGSYVTILGSPFPLGVVLLAGATFVLSVLGALVPGLLMSAALLPEQVWQGQLWRLVTWVFFETHPISLVFACLMIAWLGRDLARSWGRRRFVAIYFILAAASAAVTVLPAPFIGAFQRAAYVGSWPIVGALVIAWGLLHADRQILLYLVVPVSGRNIVYLTIGLTILYAVFAGFVVMLPHFVAQGMVLLWLDRMGIFRRLWLRVRLASYERELRRHTSHLHVVRKDDRGSSSRWVH